MIGVDTNVLVRLMVEDDEAQTRRALEILSQASENDESVFISDIVLSELVWVLDSSYKVPKKRILSALQKVGSDTRFSFEDRQRLKSALDSYQQGKGDLSDYLLGLRSEAEGALTTFTFDKGLRSDPRFTLAQG